MIKKFQLLIQVLAIFLILGCSGAFAQNSLFFVSVSGNPERAELIDGNVSALEEQYLENISRLYKNGDLLLAGTFDDGGVFMVKANSLGEAHELLKTDFAVGANWFIYETLPVTIDKGWVCEQVKPYEMIKLNFIRYTFPDAGIQTALPDEHLKYINMDDVLLAASMDKENGTREYVIFLSKNANAEAFAKNDPLVKTGNFDYQIRSCRTSEQTFCTDKSKKIN